MFGIQYFRSYERAIEREYLLTNGLGGFTSSTIIGANIRKYHGLLNVSLNPPTERYLMVSKLHEVLEIAGEEYVISSNQRVDGIDEGYKYQTYFDLSPLPEFGYRVKDIIITKKIALKYMDNTAAVSYRIKSTRSAATLKIYPFINFRDHHGNSKKEELKFEVSASDSGLETQLREGLKLRIESDKGVFVRAESYYENMYYKDEEIRGLNPVDNHYVPGYIEVRIPENSEVEIGVVATISEGNYSANSIIKEEELRLKMLRESANPKSDLIERLTLACDAYIVQRKSTGTKTVIAGYPWFTDWGRDTMIALTGLTLCTGRYSDAREMLVTFAKYLKDGLIPNMFPDEGVEPLYNTIDGSLWYFYALYKYYSYTGDKDFIKEMLPVMKSIIDNHIKGTMFDIKMDEDGLISGGNEETQLTWMDVKVKGWVVTPRHGKAVEINALWYNGLKTYNYLLKELGLEEDPKCLEIAQRVENNFMDTFWNEKGGYLYDVVRSTEKIDAIRANMMYPVSLPFSLVEGEKAKQILEVMVKHLLTPVGIRSLSPEDEEYKGIYRGDVLARDGAYHRGTTWSFLMGHFITALVKTYGDEGRELGKEYLKPLIEHLNEGCINHISEVYDGDFPHIPGGCPAQAWGTSELLRCLVEDVLI